MKVVVSLHFLVSLTLNRRSVDPFEEEIGGLSVDRVDLAPEIRRATDGATLVFGIVGYAILSMAGLAVLTANLAGLRSRRWFIALARAIGAPPRDVAAIIFLETAITSFFGLMLGAVLALILGGPLRRLGQTAFNVDLQLLSPSRLMLLAGGSCILVALTSAYPAWRASRISPLEALDAS